MITRSISRLGGEVDGGDERGPVVLVGDLGRRAEALDDDHAGGPRGCGGDGEQLRRRRMGHVVQREAG